MKLRYTSLRANGFSLIEIVIAVAVIGILAALALPFYKSYVIRAEVSEALVLADAKRINVELALLEGQVPKVSPSTGTLVTSIEWVPSAAAGPGAGALGAIVPRMALSGLGDVSALALLRMADGNWVCSNASNAGRSDALADDYLPSTCRGAGSSMGQVNTKPSCASGQELISLMVSGAATPACVPSCPTGQSRNTGNPTLCSAPPACAANEKRKPSGACAPVPPQPSCAKGEEALAIEDADYNPGWRCVSTCLPGQTRVNFNCEGSPTAAAPLPVPAASLPTGKPAVVLPIAPAAAPSSPGPQGDRITRTCYSCGENSLDVCDIMYEETTCTFPANYCMNTINNKIDGTKTVERGCATFDQIYRNWYMATSDVEECQNYLPDLQKSTSFQCSFGCTEDRCNLDQKPAKDTLWTDK